MTQYFTPALADMIRHAVNPFFIQTYTRTPLSPTPDNPSTGSVDESTDAWGEQVETTGVPIPNLPCSYMEQSVIVVAPSGPISVNRAVLLVPTTDLASPGDLVSSVTTNPDASKGITSFTVLNGPVRIEDTHIVGPMSGGTIYKECVLRATEEVLG